MRFVMIAAAAAALGANSFSASAQDERPYTEASYGACAALDVVTERLTNFVNAEDRWIDRNRDRSTSGSALTNFNERVVARNTVSDLNNELIQDYNANCTGSVLISVVATACDRPTERMRDYLYESQRCRNSRARRGGFHAEPDALPS